MRQFVRFQLRTTDVAASRKFYSRVLGDGPTDIEPLPDQARARGAPAHWLGHIGVENVEEAVRAFAQRAAIQLGPSRQTSEGGRVAILRDPGEAIVAVANGAPSQTWWQPHVVWQDLYAANAENTIDAYCALFGWQLLDRHDLGWRGVRREFTWRAGEPSVGSVADIAALTGVHSQWLFYFSVSALTPALAAVTAGGGVVVTLVTLPNESRAAVCTDPQGAAFALCEVP